MKKTCLFSVLLLGIATQLSASLVLSDKTIFPTLGIDVFTLTQTSTGTVEALGVTGSDIIGDTQTGDLAALIANPANPYPNQQLLGFNFSFSEELSLLLDPATFTTTATGAQILGQGAPLSGITNSALLSLVGVDQLGLSLLASAPIDDTLTVTGYLLTSIQPVSAVPEPAFLPLVGAAVIGLFAVRFTISRKSRLKATASSTIAG